MMITSTTIRVLEQLITNGEVNLKEMADLQTSQTVGLWNNSKDKQRAVATPSLVKLLQTLPTKAEVISAILSCEPDIRQSWQRIICARLQELGQQRDTAGLCQAITTLRQSAGILLEQLPQASLTATDYTELERSLLETPAEQAIASPKLYRVIGATASLIEGQRGQPTSPLPNVSPLDPSQNWIKGRLIQLPQKAQNKTETKWIPTSILSGSWTDYHSQDSQDNPDLATMYWVLARPWCFLLAQVVFTQEAWRAERISGELSLELDPNHKDLFDRPPKIDVVVTSADGEETLCGSLGELLLRVMQQLGVAVLTPHLNDLDQHLAPIIQTLIQRQVWDFSYGAGGHHPHYTIHPTFSDSCYRAVGSKYFNRLASSVTASIRSTCDQWVKERRMSAKTQKTPVQSFAISS